MMQDPNRLSGEVRGFYDKYSERQINVGVNERHRSILKLLKEAGLKPGHKVLEIGCGIGTVSGLILEFIGKEGFLKAIDISEKSIEIARQRHAQFVNAEFICQDVTQGGIDGEYDVVVFPDVLEHITAELHQGIFNNVAKVLRSGGFVFIHIPDPLFLDWIRINKPETLQMIDQSLPLMHFLKLAEKSGFYIQKAESYGVWYMPFEYQVILMKPNENTMQFHLLKERSSFFQSFKTKLLILWKRIL